MRLVIAEDSALLRAGIEMLLTGEGHHVLAAVESAPELVLATEKHVPDVVVTDVRMPPTHTDDGLKAALEIRRRWPRIGILVLSQYVEKRFATALLAERATGVGYLLKDRVAHVEDFLDALDRIAAGASALDPEVIEQLMASSPRIIGLDTLTDREREVTALMAEGHTNRGIADRLHVSQSSVEKYVSTIFDKLGIEASLDYSRRVLVVLRYLGSV